MKRLTGVLTISLITIFYISTASFAQNNDGDLLYRRVGIRYDKKEVDGMKIWFHKVEGTKFVPADPSMPFKTGDELRVEFESNFDGYLYFLNVEPGSDKATVIYPITMATGSNNKVRANQRYMYPPADSNPFSFDGDVKGYEIIQVIMSREQIPIFDEAVKNSEGELDVTALQAAKELISAAKKPARESGGGIVADNQPKSISDKGRGSVMSRDIEVVAPSKDMNGEKQMAKGQVNGGGIMVVVSTEDKNPPSPNQADPKPKTTTLERGQFFVYTIRFNHI